MRMIRHNLGMLFWLMVAYTLAHVLGDLWGFVWWQSDLLYLALIFLLAVLLVSLEHLWYKGRYWWRFERGRTYAPYPKEDG